MSIIEYKLTNIPGFVDFIKTGKINDEFNNYYSVNEYSTKSNEKYNIVKYSKDFLFSNYVSTYGLLRSVIFKENKMICFSPPKSISCDNFIKQYPIQNIVAEEFIEGTMINLFYNSSWEISTRNTVGGDTKFYNWSKKTFNEMFVEACLLNGLNIFELNTSFCYSFVLQHPENRIVAPFYKPQLFLVSVYKIVQENDSISVWEQDLDIVRKGGFNNTTIKFPERYKISTYTNYAELIEKYASPNTPYYIQGIVLKNIKTGERSKIRNPTYEEVRHLKGNQPNLQYQYLCLRKEGKLPEFLKYFPEFKSDFSIFREQVHMFTNNLHKNYISCYIKKQKPLNEYPDQYKTHMFKIHEKFINDLKPNKQFVTNSIVINYVNELPSQLLMYCLNLNMRKRMIDTIKGDYMITNL
uniref:T4 RNA ligase 1-like N-terminal domain-containing protein n=1 Tax=viral metagenome TaxID=1070528 RepID=A0A6C0KQJ5_9ZZZZ